MITIFLCKTAWLQTKANREMSQRQLNRAITRMDLRIWRMWDPRSVTDAVHRSLRCFKCAVHLPLGVLWTLTITRVQCLAPCKDSVWCWLLLRSAYSFLLELFHPPAIKLLLDLSPSPPTTSTSKSWPLHLQNAPRTQLHSHSSLTFQPLLLGTIAVTSSLVSWFSSVSEPTSHKQPKDPTKM